MKDVAVNVDSVDLSGGCQDETRSAGNNSANITETAKEEDAIEQLSLSVSLTFADCADVSMDDVKTADSICSEVHADHTCSNSLEINNMMESMDVDGESNDCESDEDCTNERTCLEAMTSDGQDHYLRLGDTPRRRSALRLSRIITRQQLLRRLAQGRCGKLVD